MRKRLVTCLLNALVLMVAGGVYVRTNAAQEATQATPAQANASQGRAVGEVLSVDASAKRLVIKTDDGASLSIEAGERTSISRVPEGANASEKAVKIQLSEVVVGERLFARGEKSEDGARLSARQIVVTSRAAGATAAGAGGPDAQRQQGRNIVGRITALNPAKREITIAARSREGAETVTVNLPGEQARIRRFAPDSLNLQDAVPATFAELRVGDQLRATGERSADGSRFVAEEITAGSVLRIGGTVTAINAATGELTIKAEEGGQTHTVLFGQRSMLRRIPAEVSDSLTQRREERRGERRERRREGAGGANAGAPNEQRDERAGVGGSGDNAGSGANRRGGGERGRGAGGRNLMQMLENLPAITLGEIKKGDAVLVTGTTAGQDSRRVTAVALLTGDPAFLARLRSFQGRGGRNGQNMSPGLPGDILGGGVPNPREQP